MTIKIRKRQGYLVNYDREQLYHSISPVVQTTKEQAQVVCYCDSKIKALEGIKQHLSIEELLDLVQNSLVELNFKDEAARFASYREERKRVREAKKIKVDVESTIEDYVGQLDWRVNENANQGYSVGGMILNTSGKVTANYWLSSVYPQRVGQAHRDGRIHIHDLSFLGCYCCGWDLKRLLDEGLNDLKGHIDSKPPKNLSGAVGQMVNALGVLQNEAAGAQAYSSADTYLAPFVRELRKKIEKEYRDVISMTGGTVDEHVNADRLKEYVDEKLHKEVYQCIQELIFNLNVPSRWGCVPLDTEVLTPNGWKHYDELQKNDEIFSYNTDTKTLELDRVKAIVKKKNTSGVLHCYINEKKGYEQCVTPEHRVIHKKLGSSEYQISRSEELWTAAVRQAAKLDKKTVGLVNFANGFNNDNDGLTDEEVMLAAFIYTDGILDWRKNKTVIHKIGWLKSSKRWGRKEFKECSRKLGLDWKHKHKCVLRRVNGVEWTCDMHSYRCYGDSARKIAELIGHKTSIHERFFRMNERHAKLFLDTWRKTDGYGASLQCDSELIASQIQHIAMLAGYRSAITKGASFRVKLKRKSVAVYPTKVQEIAYSGDVWCPSVVKNGTAIFRRNGKTFISGQSQTPFTNLTFDLNCPEDLKDKKPKIGGVEVEEYTYGDLQEEMNLLNNVFVEVYMKGDAKGQPFTFPIPTYNITKDFDWNSKFVDSVFEMAAKYGLPYFQNFMSSDMKPSDVRSMCVTGDTIVRGSIRKNRKWEKTGPIAISELLSYDLEDIKIQSSKGLKRLKRKLINDFNGNLIKITTDSGKTLTMTPDHPQLVYNDKDELVIVQAKLLKVGDKVSAKYGAQFCTESRRLGKSYEEQYGKKRAAALKAEYSEQRSGKAAWNSSIVLTDGQKSYISAGMLGHAVSELTKAKSSKRWLGKKNPVLQQEYWDRNNSKAMSQMSVYEKPFKKELESLGLEFVYQYVVGKHIADFYIPKKNLIIELESKWQHGVQYNNADLFRGKHKYFLEHGYNVLVLNPKTDTAYRKYINRVDTIVKIEKIKSKCKVYDVEIDNSKDAKSESHEFYANGILTHNCCRLRLDKRELLKRGNGLFGSAEQTGSIGVVTINLARLGYKHKGDLEGLYKELEELLLIAKDSLEIKRAIISKLLEQGFYPALSRYLSHFNNHFSTIGINGGNEMIRNFTNDEEDISTEYGQKIMLDMMDYLRQRMSDFQEETGNLYNLEAAPCEGAMYRFALADKKAFGDDIIQAGPKEAPYYTNSSQLPVSFTDDIFEALDLQNDLQCKYTGGTVLHLYMAERVSNADVAKTLVRKIFENYTLPYITFTPTFSICPIHGYLAGEHEYCPICDAEIEKRAHSCCNCETEKTI